MNEEVYGIDKEHGHPRAIELIPDEFFWNNFDELCPFGSDEGDEALAEFRAWRKQNPTKPILECLIWTIESVGEMNFADYNPTIADKDILVKQLADEEFDFEQYVNTLDITVIATGFGQLADEGKIDSDAKSVIQTAILRQLNATLTGYYSKENAETYQTYLQRLLQTLKKA